MYTNNLLGIIIAAINGIYQNTCTLKLCSTNETTGGMFSISALEFNKTDTVSMHVHNYVRKCCLCTYRVSWFDGILSSSAPSDAQAQGGVLFKFNKILQHKIKYI